MPAHVCEVTLVLDEKSRPRLGPPRVVEHDGVRLTRLGTLCAGARSHP